MRFGSVRSCKGAFIGGRGAEFRGGSGLFDDARSGGQEVG